MQHFLDGRQRRTDGGTEDYSSQKCVVIVFRLISEVDAIRDSGGYLTAGYRFVPGGEACAGEFHREYRPIIAAGIGNIVLCQQCRGPGALVYHFRRHDRRVNVVICATKTVRANKKVSKRNSGGLFIKCIVAPFPGGLPGGCLA